LLSTNVEKDCDYQRRYNGFYQVRRPRNWRAKYYGLLQHWKRRKNVGFAEVIRELHDLTGCVEPSSWLKLEATIRPEAPVYDAKVGRHMGVTVLPRAMAPPDRMTKLIAEYHRMTEVARTAVNTDGFRKLRVMFDRRFPDDTAFADTKKLDLMLWQSQPTEPKVPSRPQNFKRTNYKNFMLSNEPAERMGRCSLRFRLNELQMISRRSRSVVGSSKVWPESEWERPGRC
jgi:hypothetical protein